MEDELMSPAGARALGRRREAGFSVLASADQILQLAGDAFSGEPQADVAVFAAAGVAALAAGGVIPFLSGATARRRLAGAVTGMCIVAYLWAGFVIGMKVGCSGVGREELAPYLNRVYPTLLGISVAGVWVAALLGRLWHRAEWEILP
jgi:hypothetical protein